MKNIQTDEICDDPKIAYLKEKQMRKFKGHALLQSISEVTKYIAATLTTVGMAIALPEFVAAAGAGGFAAGMTAVAGTLGAPLLAAAAIATGVAVLSYYLGSNIWVDGQFNNYEICAKSTAHHMVQELEQHQNKSRADGKSWCEYDAARKATNAQQALRV